MSEAVVALPAIALAGTYAARRYRRLRWRLKLEAGDEGVMLYARRGRRRVMVARVRYDRSLGKYPDVDFDEQLADAIARTRRRCATLNAAQRNERDG